MKKVSINYRDFVADIRSGKNDSLLMERYALSSASLVHIKNELLSRGLLTVDDLNLQGGPVRTKKKINAERFLYDFRQKPDDLHLMAKYSLKPRQLRKVYLSLMEKKLLTEFEYESRNLKVPEVDRQPDRNEVPPQAQSSSTVVSVVETDLEASYIASMRNSELPEEFFKDFSGIKIGKGSDSTTDYASVQQNCSPHGSKESSHGHSDLHERVDGKNCPKCGRPKSPDSMDSCVSCGIVFSKASGGSGPLECAVWDNEVVVKD